MISHGRLISSLLICMQAFSISLSDAPYSADMKTGRPSKHPRTPFGERVLAARQAAGLTQAQVADELGITQHAYAYWERHPVALRPEQVQQLAAALNVSVESLMNEKAPRGRASGPTGKARQVFEAVSKMPRRQQEKVFAVLEPFIREHVVNGG